MIHSAQVATWTFKVTCYVKCISKNLFHLLLFHFVTQICILMADCVFIVWFCHSLRCVQYSLSVQRVHLITTETAVGSIGSSGN